jgi:hypothetical protein
MNDIMNQITNINQERTPGYKDPPGFHASTSDVYDASEQTQVRRRNPHAKKRRELNFYEQIQNEVKYDDFETAKSFDGIDNEITLLRIKIKTMLQNEPDNFRLLMAMFKTLTQMVKARYSMNKDQETSAGEAIKNIMRDIGTPLGIALINKKL